MGIVAESDSLDMVDPAIFEHLQAKIDEDSAVREELKNILQILEKQGMSDCACIGRIDTIYILIVCRKGDTINIIPCSFHTFCSTHVSLDCKLRGRLHG